MIVNNGRPDKAEESMNLIYDLYEKDSESADKQTVVERDQHICKEMSLLYYDGIAHGKVTKTTVKFPSQGRFIVKR